MGGRDVQGGDGPALRRAIAHVGPFERKVPSRSRMAPGAVVRPPSLAGWATVRTTVWRTGRGAGALAVLFMLAAETEAAWVLQLSTYVRGLTVPNSKSGQRLIVAGRGPSDLDGVRPEIRLRGPSSREIAARTQYAVRWSGRQEVWR